MEVDRISGLPEEIIHNILSFLPAKDVHKTSVLSKAFLSSWSSFPVIALDYNEFRSSKTHDYAERFTDFLRRSIERWNLQKTSLQTFDLSYRSFRSKDIAHIDDAICFAIRNGVKVLKLDMRNWLYRFPLIRDSSNSIKALKLVGVQLNFLQNLLEASPAIEKLRIDSCSFPKSFKLASSTIRSIKLNNCTHLEVLEIESPSLEMFISTISPLGVEINISSCTSLKVLYLEYANIKDEWVDQVIPQLVQLRDLIFTECIELENLRICSGSLKFVELVTCYGLQCVEIVGNTVECLNFIGDSSCDIKFSAPKVMSLPAIINTCPDITVSISTNGPLHENRFAPLWYSIQEVISDGQYCDIICHSDKDWIIPEKIRWKLVAPVLAVKHITVSGFQRISMEVVDSLLWLFPLVQTIFFCVHNDYELVIRVADTTDLGTQRKIKRMNQSSKYQIEYGTVKHDDLSCHFCLSPVCGMCWRHSKYIILLEKFDTL